MLNNREAPLEKKIPNRLCKIHESIFDKNEDTFFNERIKNRRKRKRKNINQNNKNYDGNNDEEYDDDYNLFDGVAKLYRNNTLELSMYVKMNKKLFICQYSNRKSPYCFYKELHDLIYSSEYYMACSVDDMRGKHYLYGIPSFPRINSFKLDNYINLNKNVIHIKESKYNTNTIKASNWIYDFENKIPQEINTDVYETTFVNVNKLLDETFENYRDAWFLFIKILNYCKEIERENGFYPVRRSVWDMMIFGYERKFYSNISTSDIGGLREFCITLYFLILIIYNNCILSKDLIRTVSSDKRITFKHTENRKCIFPSKTSGIYFGLFQTSKLPHKLICCTDVNSNYFNDPRNLKNWLNDFNTLIYRSAIIKYNLEEYINLDEYKNSNIDNNNISFEEEEEEENV